jgi:CubicO group peptidase (beta-lactamase class C family)
MSRLLTLAALALTLTFTSATRAGAQDAWSPEASAKVDKVFERMDRSTSPGCSMAIARDGRLVYARGYGMANLDHEIALTPSSVFHVASVSKQFTAAAIVLLSQEGRLSLDDEVRKHVPELPDFGQRVTIRQLVHHTSGLRDQWELLGLAGWRYSRDLITDEDVLQLMERQKDLNFAPGSEHLYCNTGYTLLATIVKRASGRSFRDFTTERLFKPLGMNNTHFRDDHAEIVKNHAYGYVPAGDTFRQSPTNFNTAGATSLLTTVEDLALWDRNFIDGRVGGPAFLEQMLAAGVLEDGRKIDYAFGLTHGTYRGLATVGHGGSDAGYRADFLRFPNERISVFTLCNLSTSNPGQLTRRIADIVLADRLAPPEVANDDRPEVKVAGEELARYAGLYWNSGTDAFRRFSVSEGTLQTGFGERGAPLRSLGGGLFAAGTSDVRFESGGGRVKMTETARSGAGKPVVYERAEQFDPTPAEAAEYAGVYRSDEIEPAYRIGVEEGRLMLRRLKSEPMRLEPLVRDVFRGANATLRFTRDGEGRVSGYVWNGGRVRGFRFAKDRTAGS